MNTTDHRNLTSAFSQLKGDKIKERQEGLQALKTIFQRSRAVEKYDKGDGKAWLITFQALFEAIAAEKSTFLKTTTKGGSTAAAERRLGEVSATVRWLTEKSAPYLNRKVTKSLISHLAGLSINNNTLFTPVSVDYVKAIRAIVNYTPHLEHLDSDLWVKLVQLGFNVVLGLPLRKGIYYTEDDAAIAVDDAQEEDYEEEQGTRKRGRREMSATPGPSRVTSKLSHASISREQIEYIGLLSDLLRSPSSPLLTSDPQHEGLAEGILNRLLSFIKLYPFDTSLHRGYLVALSATLSHVALNRRDAVTHFARNSWNGLLDMWGMKDKSMKEGIIVVLRVLFPFYTASDPRYDSSAPNFSYLDGVARLWQILDREADSRWGVEGLSLDCLRLQLTSPNAIGSSAFVARTFRYGWQFDSSQALAWSILELQADCAQKVGSVVLSFSKRMS